MMENLSCLSSILMLLFEHRIFFQYLAKDGFRRQFNFLTHLIHSPGSMSTNTSITMHSRLLFNTLTPATTPTSSRITNASYGIAHVSSKSTFRYSGFLNTRVIYTIASPAHLPPIPPLAHIPQIVLA